MNASTATDVFFRRPADETTRKSAVSFHVVELSKGRRAWLNTMDLQPRRHWMCGLLEVDVTVAKQRIADEKARTGESLSFTGWLISCLGVAVGENKQVQAYRKGHDQLVMFDDVNVGMLIEHASGLMGHVVEHADRKTCREIHDEIRAVQSSPAPASRGMPSWFRSLMLLPWPLSAAANAAMRHLGRRDPSMMIASSGTTFVSAVGMFGKGHGGFGISTTPHSMSVFVGGIARKPAVIDGRIEPRDMLSLTVLFDHDVIDGAPATRFVSRLVELIENAHGLDAGRSTSASTVASVGGP